MVSVTDQVFSAQLSPDVFENHTLEHFKISQTGMNGRFLKSTATVSAPHGNGKFFLNRDHLVKLSLGCVSRATSLLLRQGMKHAAPPVPQSLSLKKIFSFRA